MPTKVPKPASRKNNAATVQVGLEVEPDDTRVPASHFSAIPEDWAAICSDPGCFATPAVVFNENASPSTLVSWAWAQLATLNTLLLTQSMTRTYYEPDDVGEAARAIIGPVMNALKLSEQRAHELRIAAEQASTQ